MSMRSAVNLAVLVLAGLALAGCQNEKMSADHARLWSQNQELQRELDRERAARDQAENERSRLAAERDRLGQQLAQQTQQPDAAANEPAGAFADIPGVETEQLGRDLHVRIPGDILFEPGKATLRPAALQTLDRIAAILDSEYADRIIRVEGYTDTDPIRRSGWADNLELSLQRAAAVYRRLQERGMAPTRMYAAGFGEHQPRATKPASRRVEIVVVGR